MLHGIEPNMRWRSFCRELVGLMLELGVRNVVLLGALLADARTPARCRSPVPRRRPGSSAPCTWVARYEGRPASSGAAGRVREADLDTVSLWAAVPHYVAQPPSPKATLALLRRVEDLLDVTVPLGELPEEARAWEHGVNELAEEDSRSPSTSGRWRSRRTPPSCRRRAVTPSPASSSATCAAATRGAAPRSVRLDGVPSPAMARARREVRRS